MENDWASANSDKAGVILCLMEDVGDDDGVVGNLVESHVALDMYRAVSKRGKLRQMRQRVHEGHLTRQSHLVVELVHEVVCGGGAK